MIMQLAAVVIAASAAVAALYTLARPHWAFVLLMVMFPLKQLLQVYVPLVGNHPTIVNYAIGSMVLIAVAVRYMRREQVASAYFNPVTVMVLALYAMWIVGIFYSPSRELYLERFWTDLTYQVLLIVFMPLLVLDIFEFRRALYGLMIVGAILCLLVMFNPRSSYWAGRLYLDLGMLSTGRDKGSVLATASMGAMVALVAALIRPVRASLPVNVLRVGAFLIGMGMAIGSGSRGQVLAAGVTGIIFYPVSRRLANPKQFVLLVIGFLSLVAGLYVSFKLFIGYQNEERWNPFQMLADTTMRLDMAFHLFNHYVSSPAHWLFGLGTGYYASISLDSSAGRDYVHNIAAEVLCEHGLVGGFLFVLMMILLGKYMFRLWNMYRGDPSMRSVVALLAALGFFSLLESLKQGSMQYPAPFYWWVIMAKLAQHEQKVLVGRGELAEHESDDESLAMDEHVEDDDGLFPQPAFASGNQSG